MTYVVDENCIKCKHMDCVEVCPVDAIHSDTDDNMEKWVEINRIYAEKWPVITEKKTPPNDAKEWEGVKDKFEKHFSKNPGK